MTTFDTRGYVEPGSVCFQVKATERLPIHGMNLPYDLDIRDYNLWIREKMPVILVLFDAAMRRAYWIGVQQYFRSNTARRPTTGAKTIRIGLDRSQVVNDTAIAAMRELKQKAIQRARGDAT